MLKQTHQESSNDSMYEWDEPKRLKTLKERGLDFAKASAIFEAEYQAELLDEREDYGEERYILLRLLLNKDSLLSSGRQEASKSVLSL